MLTIEYTAKFRRDYRRMEKQGRDMSELFFVIGELASGKQLDKKYRDHALIGDWQGFRECHQNCGKDTPRFFKRWEELPLSPP